MEKLKVYNPKENKERKEDLIHQIDLEIDGKKIATAEIVYYSKPVPLYQIDLLYVNKEYQGQGYGTRIMAQIEKMLKQKHKAGVLVEGIKESSPAKGMYKRRGWQAVPKEPGMFVYNLPKGVLPEKFTGYIHRQTSILERESFLQKIKEFKSKANNI